MLATIQPIASQTLRANSDPNAFLESFNGRQRSLAGAHDLLVRKRMSGATVEDLLREQVVLGTSSMANISLAGPDLTLDPRLVVQLAFVLHELGSNACKYGALSVAAGALSVSWEVEAGSPATLKLSWRESGLPSVKAPTASGLGTTLIERTLEANQGEASFRYLSDGFACEISLPLPEGNPEPWNTHPQVREANSGPNQNAPQTIALAKRILVVEDDPLLSMELEDELTSRGFVVLGPASDIEGAKRLIAEESMDAALLDANLEGRRVDDVAAALEQKGVPFAFATGYGRDALPASFQDTEMLTKPYDPDQLMAIVHKLLSRRGDAGPGRR
jgi:two-component sensor histidine kinase/CheY-like chemotaxis protein